MTEKWMYQYPSTSLTRSHVGDEEYASRFRGDADNLLYQLKNLMTFRKLGQLKMVRVFTDGTVITASSHFGYDSVIVDVSKSELISEEATQRCTITFTYFNAYVPPMRYPGEVREGENEGIDYVKSYYTLDVSDCPSCEDEAEWEFTFNYETDEQIDYYDAEPNNHCVYSKDAGCSGEIIEQGIDLGGTYIIWKVYTEASEHNRSGLGYAQFHATLKAKETGTVICEFDEIIGVDCCEKDSSLRDIAIWWEKVSEGIHISYNGFTLYKVPEVITTVALDAYIDEGKSFYALTEDTNGSGCLPFEWTITGYGVLSSNDTNIASIGEEEIPRGSDDETVLTVIDRCGSTDSFEADPCCENAPALSINYTSLMMVCGTEQDLEAEGGCSPYTWGLLGGGSLSETEGKYTTYTAPITNSNCVSNPTIILTDSCPTISELQLAVNCSSDDAWVLVERDFDPGTCVTVASDSCPPNPPGTWSVGIGTLRSRVWNCSGELIGDCIENLNLDRCFILCGDPDIWFQLGFCDGCVCTGSHDIGGRGLGFDQLLDARSDEQKAEGCCPINPFTGLPM